MKKYFLRKIAENDLEQIFKWRNSKNIKNCMIKNEEIRWENHCKWFDDLQKRTDRDFQVFCIDEKPIGIVSFVDIDKMQCSWGFYIGDEKAPKGAGLMLGYYAIEHVFNKFGIKKINSQVIEFNQASVSFHKKMLFSQVGIEKNKIFRDNIYNDLILFELDKQKWNYGKKPILQEALSKLEGRQENG